MTSVTIFICIPSCERELLDDDGFANRDFKVVAKVNTTVMELVIGEDLVIEEVVSHPQHRQSSSFHMSVDGLILSKLNWL